MTLNEAKRIGDCLASVRELTDDIVVVDAHSRDATREICRDHGARVFTRAWCGYSEQKNFGNAQARHDWILSLDADERVTPELAANIRHLFARETPGHDAYTMRFENYFGTRHVRFGAWNPEWHVRLFDRRLSDWNEDEVHEGLRRLEGCTVGRLAGCVRHLTVRSAAELAAKTERYSELFAAKLRRRGCVPGWAKVWLNPAWRFARDYFLRLGLLDGAVGWRIACEGTRYTHLKYALAQPAAQRWSARDWRAFGSAIAIVALMFAATPRDAWRGLWSDPLAPTQALPFDPGSGASHVQLDDVDDRPNALLDDDDILT